jgi:hypothetical protein
MRKKLPIGIQTFREIREEGYYYVDKSGFALSLIEQGKYYFLSRPRRFGKSLFLDTLKELFEANEPLFRGLAAHDTWDWSVPYPGYQDPMVPARNVSRLYDILIANDIPALKDLFRSFYAAIPHDWYRKNQLANFEGYYASIFYSYFAALGLDIQVEDSTNKGRIDMAVRYNGHIYLFEFKVVEMTPEGRALEQLQTKGYAEKYRQQAEPIHLIGVEFSRESRNIVGFETAEG